ncbi:MAG: hypothetical protein GY791_07035 [Alphaproteobacteria bacterium]|nr:hypothetical protein [Alphaproteobacteria bacterium]
MSMDNPLVTVATYFVVHDGRLDEFKARCRPFVEKSSTEEKCMFVVLGFDGNQGMSREGYRDADGVLEHIENVRELMEENLTMIDLTRVELHGPQNEVEKSRTTLSKYSPEIYTIEDGFRR